ncbi:MAG: SO_0444 family Cu/Zn efflux transporter [Desulfurivibrionaceae bacterium]
MTELWKLLLDSGFAAWEMLLEASPYMILGLFIGGIIKVYMPSEFIIKHLGTGRISSVVKASLLGIPLPLCSCSVLPTAASLKKQGANRGATTAFLISTPESGIDSISISYAMLDPILTVARPVAAFVTAFVSGVTENLLKPPNEPALFVEEADSECACGSTCSTADDQIGEEAFHHKLISGIKYAFDDLWGDLAFLFFIGVIIGGIITSLIPEDLIKSYLGGGIKSMLLMLLAGVPLYICATASTPIAAALILKGVSPGAALVFLLAGPATNVTSLSVLLGVIGKRGTVLYLSTIAVCSLLFGLLIDVLYNAYNIDPQVVVGKAAELVPEPVQLISALLLIILSVKPLYRKFIPAATA